MRNAVVVSTAAFWLAWATIAWAQNATVAIGTKQRMDIVITRHVVAANGERVGPPAQTVRYRVSRVKTDAGWHTTMTLGAPDGISRDQSAKNPFFGGRVEFDHSGAFAMFDNAGREVSVPTTMAALVPRFGDEWSDSLSGLSMAPRNRKARVEEVEARYGAPAGRIRGLTQYLRRAGDDTEELLYDEALSIPVELNVLRGDVLTGQIAFEYVEQPGRGLVRRRTRSEALVNDNGHRTITTTEFSNLIVERER